MHKPRQELSEQQLKNALDQCAAEPIHIPGSIQTHGALLAVDQADYRIQQVSENIERFTGYAPKECIGQNLSRILGSDILKIRPIVVNEELQPIQSTNITLLDTRYDVAAHVSGESIIIEFEPAQVESGKISKFYDDTRNFAVGMHKAGNLQKLYDHVVTSIRNVTGFDRVKLYKFDPEWNGSVIAESRAEFMPSYFGMRFPATDIPEQARLLYTKNYLRLIPDIRYASIPVIPVTDKPLDLSLAMLRSVSSVHIQYLENMNIRASMSVSIIQNGKLWGLVACHHNSPLYFPYQTRMVAEIMGHTFSAQLSTMESQVKKDEREKQIFFIEKLNAALEKNYQLDKLMESTHQLALEAMKADGMVVKQPPADFEVWRSAGG